MLISPLDKKCLVDTIYTGIGAYPRLQFSLTLPFILTDPTICEDGMAALLSALENLATRGIKNTREGLKPLLIAVSATAGKNLWKSIPWILVPLYYYLLRQPQADKFNMEKLMIADQRTHVRDFVIIRPAILTHGEERGIGSMRAGWEWVPDGRERKEKEDGPAVGWSISRKDAGAWVFKKVIVEGGWEGMCVSLCY